MLPRPYRLNHYPLRAVFRPTKAPRNAQNVYQQRRTFINQLSGINRIHRIQIGHDLRRVGTLVLLPPLLVASYIAACGILGFVGAQVWLEYFAMRPGPAIQKDEQDRGEPNAVNWGWEEAEDWSGGEKGGTDPSFGMLARIAIRSAWLFNTWAGQMGEQNIYSQSQSSSASGSYIQNAILGSTDRAHALAEQSLAWALEYIDNKYPEKPIPHTLLLRHADILERIATSDALSGARREVSTVYRTLPRGSYARSRLALRLGGLCIAEGGQAEALRFWKEALAVRPTREGGAYSPAEERLIADAYLQLSALYSNEAQLDQATELHQKALQTLESFLTKTRPTFQNTTGIHPESILHDLYLKHRAAVLSIHAAEVHFAQSLDTQSTIRELHTASTASAGVAMKLVANEGELHAANPVSIDMASTSSEAPSLLKGELSLAPPPTPHLAKFYVDSMVLNAPATSLFRDAFRATSQSLALIGMLLEQMDAEPLKKSFSKTRGRTTQAADGSSPDPLTQALTAYQQALGWSGTTLKTARALGIPEQEMMRVRRRVEVLQRRIANREMMAVGQAPPSTLRS